MAQQITALQIQKRDKNRVNVFLDGEYAFAVGLSAALALRKGQTLTPADIEKLKAGYERHKAYDKAMHFLSFRARSEKEVTDYLTDKAFSAETIAHTMSRLSEEGYLDDAKFARLWLIDRERMRPRGSRALTYELRQKGIADDIIAATLSDLDEEHSAWQAVEPKLRQWHQLDRQTLQKKLTGFLNRRGFNYDICRATFEKAWAALHGEDE